MGKQRREEAKAAAAAAKAMKATAKQPKASTQPSPTTVSIRPPQPTDEITAITSQLAGTSLRDELPEPVVHKRQPFRFLDLPAELRLRIYDELLHVSKPIDLDPLNYHQIAPRLRLFLTCRQIHHEAHHVFYRQPVRLYPTHGRFFHTKRALLERLPALYRREITTLDLRLGPGWSAPPRNQHTRAELGLADCANLRRLRVFIEIDPSERTFDGFRGKNATEDTYLRFCLGLLDGVFAQCPGLHEVEFDAYPAVGRDAPLLTGLVARVAERGRRVAWGPLRGWDDEGGPREGFGAGRSPVQGRGAGVGGGGAGVEEEEGKIGVPLGGFQGSAVVAVRA